MKLVRAHFDSNRIPIKLLFVFVSVHLIFAYPIKSAVHLFSEWRFSEKYTVLCALLNIQWREGEGGYRFETDQALSPYNALMRTTGAYCPSWVTTRKIARRCDNTPKGPPRIKSQFQIDWISIYFKFWRLGFSISSYSECLCKWSVSRAYQTYAQ